ncbi:MAG: uroporphyrinogen-III C-methyltransferase [Acaryochloridaceae cyanobacterium CSU_3_4]|nr:uroporphyrinogen-III C-methyltransferase [Acaryochloridaceae cyanobacterium CSU_3_4]
MSSDRQSKAQTPRAGGKVFILGAGPGKHNHLTVVGQNLLAEADVILYDALINSELLNLAKKNCLRIPVGKRGKGLSTLQADINQLLVNYCQQGKQVVRLKSGDPFIFGRTASEILALKGAGCPVTVLPGLSSALAAPLLAGIPLTDPQLSSHFTVLSGHDPEGLDWPVLAQLDTLVILMGGQQLAKVIVYLQQHGQPHNRPIAIIRQGGWQEQQVWTGTLADILSQTQGESLSPCVIVVGEVVTLRQTLGRLSPVNMNVSSEPSSLNMGTDFSMALANQPLFGKTILVTRAVAQSQAFSQSLTEAGAVVMDMPALTIGPPSSWAGLDDAIASLDQFDWLILTSANGVTGFLERLFHQGKDTRALASLQIAVVGRKTAKILEQQGLKADYIPPDYVADALVKSFPGREALAGQKFLFPRVESGGRDILVQQFTAQGATVVEVAAYESACPDTVDLQVIQAFEQQAIDLVTFASSKTVRYFQQLIQQAAIAQAGGGTEQTWQQWLAPLTIASIGPQTSLTCRQVLGRVDIEAPEYTLEGLTQSIIDHFSPTNQPG